LSVRIDDKDFTEYIRECRHSPDGSLYYSGLVRDPEGLEVQRLLYALSLNKPIIVEDSKHQPHGFTKGVYNIISRKSSWKGALFVFDINLRFDLADTRLRKWARRIKIKRR
jgi:hypothetical protein